MTRLTKILFLFFVGTLLSCSKDDDNTSNGKIVNGDIEYDLNYAYLSHKDSEVFQIYLSSDKITFENGIREFSDNSKTTIELAFYKRKDSIQSIANFYPLSTWINGQTYYEPPFLVAAAIDFDLKKVGEFWEPKERYTTWSDGSSTISEIKNGYLLDFTFIRDDKIIKGYYNGFIQIIE